MAAILTLRRGTTTPSLAQSELFFNTSTQTLNVGGTSGTITLVKLGSNTGNITLTGNLGIVGGISGSTLDITGNAKIDGNVLIGGNIVLGTGSNDIITVNAPFTGSIIPQEDGIDDVGSITKRFRKLHVVSASIDNISLPGSGILSSSNENFTIFSQSVDSRLDSLQLDSQSQDSRLDSLESFTSSQASNNNDIIELFATASIHEVRIDNLSSLTSSYATTGSNVFRGNQTISGSINISGSTTILGGVNANIFMNPQTLTADVVVPDNTNALLLGPVNIGGSISLGVSSSLLVLPEDFTSFASTGSNQFRGNQYITGSIIPEGSGSHDLGSLANPFRDLYLSSASLRLVKDGQILSELSANQSNLTISSSTTYFTRNVNVSGSVTAQLFSGSFSGSFIGTLPSQDGRLTSLEQKSASVDISVSQLNQYTSSLKTAISVNGSNLTVNGDLMVIGTTTQINSTQVNIGENIIELNYGGALTKGGFYVKDATGNFTSGSMLWDSTIDRWIAGPSGSESVVLLRGGDNIVSGAAQITSSLDSRYLEINGDNVFTGSSQIEITNTSGFSTFSSSLKTTDDGQDSRLNNLQLTSQSQHNRISQLESDSGSQGGRIGSLEQFTSSQQTLNGFYNSYTSSNNNRVNNLESFTSSIDSTIKNKINLEGVVSSSSNTSTISLSIQSGVISGSIIGGVVSGSSQLTSSLNTLYEVSGSVAQLVGIYQVSGSLGSAAWYNVSASISDGNPQVLGNAGAVKNYIDQALITVGAGDITAVVAGVGISGGATSGPATLSLDTSSAHFTNGVITSITSFSSSVDTRLDSLEAITSSFETTGRSIVSGSSQLTSSFDLRYLVTGSVTSSITQLNSFTSSINSKTGSYATTGSNSFNGSQQITGSLVVSQNITGSASASFVSLAVNTTTPTQKIHLKGIVGVEAGTTGGNLADQMIFGYVGSNLTQYNHKIQTSHDAQAVLNKMDFLIANSSSTWKSPLQLRHDRVITSGSAYVTGDLIVTGSINGLINATNGVISGSSQINLLLPSGVVSGSSQILGGSGIFSSSAQLPSGVVSGSSQLSGTTITDLTIVNLTTINETASVIFSSGSNRFGDFGNDTHSFTGSVQISGSLTTIGASTATSFNGAINATNGVISGSSQITATLPAGVVSGSSQVDATATTNFNSGIKTKLDAEGVISGSSQVTRTLQQITDTGASTSNAITITNSTTSTSKTTGALIVTGGIGTSGDIFAGGDIVAYASSDIRLKTNLELISNPLHKINQIGGYSFEWNVDKQSIYSGKDYGVIAQEIEQILPELVDTRESGYKAVKYDKLISLLIEGIKELSKQVEELKEKINQG
jgi:hypothetical protein